MQIRVREGSVVCGGPCSWGALGLGTGERPSPRRWLAPAPEKTCERGNCRRRPREPSLRPRDPFLLRPQGPPRCQTLCSPSRKLPAPWDPLRLALTPRPSRVLLTQQSGQGGAVGRLSGGCPPNSWRIPAWGDPSPHRQWSAPPGHVPVCRAHRPQHWPPSSGANSRKCADSLFAGSWGCLSPLPAG